MSAVYFNLNHEIKQNCNFDYYFNKTDITPSMLDMDKILSLQIGPDIKDSYVLIITTYQ